MCTCMCIYIYVYNYECICFLLSMCVCTCIVYVFVPLYCDILLCFSVWKIAWNPIIQNLVTVLIKHP